MFDILFISLQALILLIFVNRYLGKLWLWAFKPGDSDEFAEDYQPTVSVVVPLYNEGESIRATIRSLLSQEYPEHKLNVIIVDDCSTDGSYFHACREAKTSSRVRVLRNKTNMGKRRSINRAVRVSTAEIIVSVDSDVFAAPDAVSKLIRRFTSDDIAAVGGRIDVENKHDNWLSKMQTVKYFYSYYVTKNIEPGFKSVMCLSGCLTAYRRHVLMELEPILEGRSILGVPIKYGEDRFLTRHIIKAGYKTTMALDAVCKTKVPTTVDHYFSQQLRWRRSNLVDYVAGFSHVWRAHPAISIHYFSQFAGILTYPLLVVSAAAAGWLWPLVVGQMVLMVLMAAGYVHMARNEKPEDRVGPLYILALGIIAPVTYCILIPLALFTLDSGSWETRVVSVPATAGPQSVADTGDGVLAPVVPIHAYDGDLSASNRRDTGRQIAAH